MTSPSVNASQTTGTTDVCLTIYLDKNNRNIKNNFPIKFTRPQSAISHENRMWSQLSWSWLVLVMMACAEVRTFRIKLVINTACVAVVYRGSILGAYAERSSTEWVCIPEITSDSKWFLWNTNSRGWSPFRMGAHDKIYFFHNVFPVITSQNIGNHSHIVGIQRQIPEITAEYGRKTCPSLRFEKSSINFENPLQEKLTKCMYVLYLLYKYSTQRVNHLVIMRKAPHTKAGGRLNEARHMVNNSNSCLLFH